MTMTMPTSVIETSFQEVFATPTAIAPPIKISPEPIPIPTSSGGIKINSNHILIGLIGLIVIGVVVYVIYKKRDENNFRY